MTVLLALALFAPALVLLWARLAPTAVVARKTASTAALVVAAGWLALLLGDAQATLGRFAAGAAPAAIGVWLLVAALTWPTQRLPVVIAFVAGGVSVGGLALLAGSGDMSDAAGALAIAVAVVVLGARREDDGGMALATAGAAGAGLLSLGVAWDGVVLTTIGCAVVAAASAARARRVGSVVLPAALVIGIASSGGDRVAVVLAVAGAVLAARPAVALAMWALAAAAAGAPAGASLLGASAVLAAVVVNPLAAVAALPGAAATVAALADAGDRTAIALSLLAAATVYRLVHARAEERAGAPARPTTAALVAGAWLLVAPQTWSWAGSADLRGWRTGIVVAAVGACVGAFVVASFTELTFSLPAVDAADPATSVGDPRWARRAAIVALVALAGSGGVLVVSSFA